MHVQADGIEAGDIGLTLSQVRSPHSSVITLLPLSFGSGVRCAGCGRERAKFQSRATLNLLPYTRGIARHPLPSRPSFPQAASWIQELGGYNVLNLDCWGSSTFCKDGRIYDHPTCNDVPAECERPVTGVTCVF